MNAAWSVGAKGSAMKPLALAFAAASALAACATRHDAPWAAAPFPTAARLIHVSSPTDIGAAPPALHWTRTADEPGEDTGQDPLILVRLLTEDGRALVLSEANHAPNDLRAQAPGGTLARAMGLGAADRPTLYYVADHNPPDAPPFCAPTGPGAVGVAWVGSDSLLIAAFPDAGFAPDPDPYGMDRPNPQPLQSPCASAEYRLSPAQ